MTDPDIRVRHAQDEVAFVYKSNHGWGYRHAHHDRMVLLDEVDRLSKLWADAESARQKAECDLTVLQLDNERLKRIIAGMS